MSKTFEHGKLRVTPQDATVGYSSMSEFPDLVVHYDLEGEKTKKYIGLKMSFMEGTGQQEIHRTLESPALTHELRKFIFNTFDIDVVRFYPEPDQLKFRMSYPDFKMGEVYAKDMKVFAKMNLGSLFVVRMYRPERRNELLGSMGIFGVWTCGEERGVFSIDGPGPSMFDCAHNGEVIGKELTQEFKARWPLYPEAEFKVMDYYEVQPHLNPATK